MAIEYPIDVGVPTFWWDERERARKMGVLTPGLEALLEEKQMEALNEFWLKARAVFETP